MNKILAGLMTILGSIFILVPFVVLYGAISTAVPTFYAYEWFVKTQFGWQEVSYWNFVGLHLFVGTFIINTTVAYMKKENIDQTKGLVTIFIAPWLMLLCFYIIKLVVY